MEEKDLRLSVVFDMDGVILDTEAICLRCWEAVAEEFSVRDAESMFLKCVGTTHKKTHEIVAEHMGPNFPVEEFFREGAKVFHEIEATEGLPLKKGVLELMEYLSERGADIVLATSTAADAAVRELRNAGVLGYFKELVTGDLVANSKPDPEIYLLACQKLGIQPCDAYAIEDSRNGVVSAASAGLHTIMVPDMILPTEETRALSEIVLPDLLEVRDYLAMK